MNQQNYLMATWCVDNRAEIRGQAYPTPKPLAPPLRHTLLKPTPTPLLRSLSHRTYFSRMLSQRKTTVWAPHSAPHTSIAILEIEMSPSVLNFPVNGTEGRNAAHLESGSTQLTNTVALHWQGGCQDQTKSHRSSEIQSSTRKLKWSCLIIYHCRFSTYD